MTARNTEAKLGRVAVVTGGTRGIGRAVCERLRADGFNVAAFYAGNDTAAQACRQELGILALKCDVGDRQQCITAQCADSRIAAW